MMPPLRHFATMPLDGTLRAIIAEDADYCLRYERATPADDMPLRYITLMYAITLRYHFLRYRHFD